MRPAERLVEEALLLQRLAEHQPQHRAEAGVGQVLDPVAPAVDERLRLVAVVAVNSRCCAAVLVARGA